MNESDFNFWAAILIILFIGGILVVIDLKVIRPMKKSDPPKELPSDTDTPKESPSESARKFSGPPSASEGFTSKYPTGPDIKYTIHVSDNYGSDNYKHRDYEVYEDAVEECKKIVEETLCQGSPDRPVSEIVSGWGQYGETPSIVPEPEGGDFDAREYAKERAWSISKVSVRFVKSTFTTSKYPTGPDIKYTIHVKHNNSPSHTYKHGDYDSYEDAVEECKSFVEEDYLCTVKSDLPVKFLMAMYSKIGRTPWIEPKPEGGDFDALEYVRERVKSISKVPNDE